MDSNANKASPGGIHTIILVFPHYYFGWCLLEYIMIQLLLIESLLSLIDGEIEMCIRNDFYFGMDAWNDNKFTKSCFALILVCGKKEATLSSVESPDQQMMRKNHISIEELHSLMNVFNCRSCDLSCCYCCWRICEWILPCHAHRTPQWEGVSRTFLQFQVT